jgi:hypothetical protein
MVTKRTSMVKIKNRNIITIIIITTEKSHIGHCTHISESANVGL